MGIKQLHVRSSHSYELQSNEFIIIFMNSKYVLWLRGFQPIG